MSSNKKPKGVHEKEIIDQINVWVKQIEYILKLLKYNTQEHKKGQIDAAKNISEQIPKLIEVLKKLRDS